MDKQVFFQHLMFRFVIEFLAETESPALGIIIVDVLLLLVYYIILHISNRSNYKMSTA